MPTAAYDEIADWYEHEFADSYVQRDNVGVGRLIDELLDPGTGRCLEVGCGTGFHADRIRRPGRVPVGVDLSADMLRHASDRLPVARALAVRAPRAAVG